MLGDRYMGNKYPLSWNIYGNAVPVVSGFQPAEKKHDGHILLFFSFNVNRFTFTYTTFTRRVVQYLFLTLP